MIPKFDEELLARLTAFVEKESAQTKPKPMQAFMFALIAEGDMGRGIRGQEAMADGQPALQKMGAERPKRAAEIALALLENAVAMADMKPRRQEFEIAAYATFNTQLPPTNTLNFSITPQHTPKDALAIEAPTSIGGMAQFQRTVEHVLNKHESIVDKALDIQEENMNRMERIMQMTLNRNEFLEKQGMEMANLLQQSLDKSAERQLNVYRGTLEANREERMWRALEVMAPQILGKIADRWGAGPASLMARKLLSDPMKAKMIYMSLEKPEDKALFKQIADTYGGLNLLGDATAPSEAAPAAANGSAKPS